MTTINPKSQNNRSGSLSVKTTLKRIIPRSLLELRRRYIERRYERSLKDLPTDEIFGRLYRDGFWGKSDDPEQKFFSGSGSHDPKVVNTYVSAIENFLNSLDESPDVVDLGCGDFAVGKKIRRLCRRYVACDIVPSLIAWNTDVHNALNVDFRVLDLTKDELPPGGVVFIRQVLQHLSNDQIIGVLPKLAKTYRYLVLTEHLPGADNFVPNVDKQPGPSIRLELNSGVVLTKPPFDLQVLEERVLCEVGEYGGLIRTHLYRLN